MLELLIVVGIVSIIAAVLLLPADNPSDGLELEAAAREVAAALRFAQSEARRSGIPHGVELKTGTQQMRLYRVADTTADTPTKVFTVYHPTDISLYNITFSSDRFPATFVSANVFYQGLGAPKFFTEFFGGSGTPGFKSGGISRVLTSAQITLAHAGRSITINVAAQSGTVSVL